MASGYRNSAGTDLDNLFYVSNGNAGAIGFRASNGQDLGNRFSNASPLGYAVGYRNSAGTDLGYLRGKVVAPVIISRGVTLNKISDTWEYEYSGSEGQYSHPYRTYQGAISVTGNYNIGGTWEIQIQCQYNRSFKVVASGSKDTVPTWEIGRNKVTVLTIGADAHPSIYVNFIFYDSAYDDNDSEHGGADWEFDEEKIYVWQRMYNAAGSSPWYENNVTIPFWDI